MPTGDEFPEAFFRLILCILLTAIMFVCLYWVVRVAVRDALRDTDERRSDNAP
jgi:hypothetical protein